jgi:hypothetical protein
MENRPLDPIYGIVFLGALYVKIRHGWRTAAWRADHS